MSAPHWVPGLGVTALLALGAGPAAAGEVTIAVGSLACGGAADGTGTFTALVANNTGDPVTISSAAAATTGTCGGYVVTEFVSPIADGSVGEVKIAMTAPADVSCVIDLAIDADGATTLHAVRVDARACFDGPPTLDVGALDLGCTLDGAGVIQPNQASSVTIVNTGVGDGVVTIAPRDALACASYLFNGATSTSFPVPHGIGSATLVTVATDHAIPRGCAYDTTFTPFVGPALGGGGTGVPIHITQRDCSPYDYVYVKGLESTFDLGNLPFTQFGALDVQNPVAQTLPVHLVFDDGAQLSFIDPSPTCQGATCDVMVPALGQRNAPVAVGGLGERLTTLRSPDLGLAQEVQAFGFGVEVDAVTGRHELGTALRDPGADVLRVGIPVQSAQPITAVSLAETALIGLDLDDDYFEGATCTDGVCQLATPHAADEPVPVVCDPGMAPPGTTRATGVLHLWSTQYPAPSAQVESATPVACDLAACSAPLVTDDELAFGEVSVGDSREATLPVRACTTGLSLTAIAIDAGAPFVPLVSGPQVLGRDSSLRVRFAPTTAGEFDVAATLTITDADDGDATSTVVVHLRGRGVATSVGEASYYACNTSGGDGAGGAGLIVLAATLTMRRRRRATR